MAKNKNPLAVVILAAGKGTRMNSPLPKVMHSLAGVPMISWLLRSVEDLEPKRIIVVTGPDMDLLQQAVSPHQTVVQQKQNGTADAVKAAIPLLADFQGDVLVLLGDTPLLTAATLQQLIAARAGAGMAVLAARLSEPAGYGRIIMRPDGLLQRIVEHKDAGDAEKAVDLVNTGAFCIDGMHLARWLDRVDNRNAQGEYYITDLPAVASAEGFDTRVQVTPDCAEVRGCNTQADLALLEKTIQGRLRLKLLQEGVRMLDPASVWLQHDTVIAPGALIEPHVFFGPEVEIAAGAHIRAFSYIEGAKIAENVSIGPFARLRPGSEIAEEAKIGNFVEIKKSKIGQRSKINHLAYVGDCSMGEDVNFGAGAITVNYDGFEKHETLIGKGAMIGSNANLVAPLDIGEGAFVAAGSTITKDIPADALAVARAETRIVEGWAAANRKKKRNAKTGKSG